MTLYEFKALSEIEQAEAVWSGTFLDRENTIVKRKAIDSIRSCSQPENVVGALSHK